VAISDNYVPTKTIGNGVTTAFSAPWNVIAAAFIRVFFENTTTGVQVQKFEGTDFTLVFSDTGLTVTFLATSIPPSTENVIISREIAKDQTDPYKTSTGFDGKVLENSLDKLTGITQDMQDTIGRTLRFPVGSTLSGNLPAIPVDNFFLTWDGVLGDIKSVNPTSISAGAFDVLFSGLATNDFFIFNNSGSVWENKPPASARDSIGLDTDDTVRFLSVSVNQAISGMFDFEVTGHSCLTHVATSNNEVGSQIKSDAAGFADVKALFIDYTTGAIAALDDEAVTLTVIDASLATGGCIVAHVVQTLAGSASVYALRALTDVAPILQDSGGFGDMDSALVNATDRLTEFTSTGSDIAMFVANSDTVTVGDAAQFSGLSFDLDTVASGAGVKPTFEYSTGVGTWAAFSPVDGTDGFRNTGVIAWVPSLLTGWVVGTGSEFLIRITRTQGGLGTVPIENIVQRSSSTTFKWDKNGNLIVNSISFDGGATTFTGGLVVQKKIGTTAASSTFTTLMVNDDTVPQNTEGGAKL